MPFPRRRGQLEGGLAPRDAPDFTSEHGDVGGHAEFYCVTACYFSDFYCVTACYFSHFYCVTGCYFLAIRIFLPTRTSLGRNLLQGGVLLCYSLLLFTFLLCYRLLLFGRRNAPCVLTTPTAKTGTHIEEFPPVTNRYGESGRVFLAGCSPAEPASASSTCSIYQETPLAA
jgi:hypothetical protein